MSWSVVKRRYILVKNYFEKYDEEIPMYVGSEAKCRRIFNQIKLRLKPGWAVFLFHHNFDDSECVDSFHV